MKHKKIISSVLVNFFVAVNIFASYTAVYAQDTQKPFSRNLSDEQRRLSRVFTQFAGFQEISLGTFVGILIYAFIGLLAIMFLALIVYGGYVWMMARGNEEEVRRARGIIRHSIIGLAITLSAYAIGYWVLYWLSTAGSGGAGAPLGG